MNPAQNLSQEHHEFLMSFYTDNTRRAIDPIKSAIGQGEEKLEAARLAGYLTTDGVDRLTGHLADLNSDLSAMVEEHVKQSVDYVEQNG